MDDIRNAALLLQSIGVQNLCHDALEYLPNCHEDEASFSYDNTMMDAAAPLFLRGSSVLGQDHARQQQHRFLEPRTEFDSLQEAETYYTYNILGAMFCVSSVALIAGLFLGLMTLDVLQLRIILRSSIDEDEKLYAQTVLPIVEERHLLLVTLLLLNALAYETLPIFLDALVPSWMAILLSTTLVMFFGEILPSGIFMGPHQLYLGYKLAPLTRFFLWVMYPFAKPLALTLDYLVQGDADGEDEGYHRGELSALVRIQYEDSKAHAATRTYPDKIW